MRASIVLLLLCLTAIGIGTALFARPAEEAPPKAAAATPAPGDAGADAAAAKASSPAPADVADLDADPTASDALADPGRTEGELGQDPRRTPSVCVRRGAAGVPVAEAEVFFVTAAAAEQRQVGGTPLPRGEWPERFGQRVTTDAAGMARLPAAPEPWLVSAQDAGEFAFAVVQQGLRVVDLHLQPDETITVQVQRGDGSPGASVPVALLQHHERAEAANEIWHGYTDAAGLAVARHFQIVREDARGATDKERFAAMLVMTLPTPVLAEFAGRPAGPAPVRLLLPPTGSVEALLVDQRDTPLLTPATIALSVERPRDWTAPFAVPPQLDRPRQAKPAGAVPVRFQRIGSGASVRVSARLPHVDRRGPVSEPLFVPLQPDAVLQTRLALPAELAVLAGRLLRDDGKPFGPATVSGCLWRADRPLAEIALHSIADGRFDVVLRPEPLVPELWLELRASIGEGDQRREVGARVQFAALRESDRRELGDIVLGEIPPLCSGIVVDDRGEPVADAEVVLQRRLPPQPAAPRSGAAARREAPTEEEAWAAVPLRQSRTDGEGRFVVLGSLPPGPLRVRADSNQHFAASQPLRFLGEQLRIAIERNGVLRGRVLLPDWLADGTVTLTLRPFDPALQRRDTRSLSLSRRRGGRFALEPLRAGRYDAIVTVRNLPEPLCQVHDVFVVPGETRDLRFQPLDLRNALFRYRLRSVDQRGQPLAQDGPILLRVRRPDGTTADAGYRWQRGRAELITGSPIAEIVAFARGCEPTAVTLGAGDHDVFLRQLIPAQLYLPGARHLCGPQRRVRVSTILTEETGFPQSLSGVDQRTGEAFSFPRWELGKSNGAWLLASDNVEVPLARSGKYEVVLRIHATESERSPQASVPLGVFDLRVDGSALLPVTIPVDAQKVSDALDQLARRSAPRQNGR